MARTTGKKQSKAATSSTNSQVTASPSPTSSSIPEPFVVAPVQLRPFFSTLPTNHVYAIHVDTNTIDLKKRVYTVPILLNLVISLFLCIRVYFAAPVYLDQIITIFGYDTAWKVEPQDMSYQAILNTVVNRSGLLMMDYAIFGFIGSWPWEFIFGSKYSRYVGPWGWRRALGFRETEIAVRKGRKWDDALFKEDNKSWSREDELLIQVKVDAAMRKDVTTKTGYLLLDRDWDLDFKGMIDAHRLLEKGRINIKDLNHIVLIHHQNQWLLWRVREDEPVMPKTQNDAKINDFRTKLASSGHEDVFFRWIEIIQYETSLPGGFTEAKQTEAIKDLRKLLADRKIDVDKFWTEVGGRAGIPGLSPVG